MPPGRTIDTLFLDAGGVLVVPNWDRVSGIFAAHGLHVPAAALSGAEPDAKFAIDTERLVATSTDAQRGGNLFEEILARIGIAASPAREAALADVYAYHMAHNLWETVPADVPPALERFRALGLTMAVVSNANGLVGQALARVGLAGYFQTICDSCVEGVEKPDPRFFELVLERTKGQPATTLHVGDLYHVDVVGARRARLHAVLLDPHDLYGTFDVRRVRALGDLAALLEAGVDAPWLAWEI